MKNKKGFTLVELLAVIVILALIMGIAVVSVGNVINTSKEKAFRETAASILNGVKQRLFINNIEGGSEQYTFSSAILEKGGVTSAYGNSILYSDSGDVTYNSFSAIQGDNQVFKITGTALTCTNDKTKPSYVYYDTTNKEFKICLKDSKGYILNSNENDLIEQKATITTPSS